MIVEKIEQFDAFQLTTQNSSCNASWPQWMHEAWNLEFLDQYSITRRCKYIKDADESELMMYFADIFIPVCVGDYILRDQKGHLFVITEYIFRDGYRIV